MFRSKSGNGATVNTIYMMQINTPRKTHWEDGANREFINLSFTHKLPHAQTTNLFRNMKMGAFS